MSAGQAPRRHWPLALRLGLGLLAALPLLAGLALGVFAWRLSADPVASSFLARQIEAGVNLPGHRLRVEIGRATIAWQGWHGEGAPIDIRLSDVILRDAAGRERGHLPEASVTLALGPLLRGVLAPSSIEMHGPSLTIRRDTEGGIALDSGPDAAPAVPEAEPHASQEGFAEILNDLMRPPEDRLRHTSFRRIRVTGGSVTVRDELLGLDWALRDPIMDLRRLPAGGIDADGEATLQVNGVDIPVHVTASVVGAPLRFSVGFDLPVLRPSEVASLLPPLGPLAILNAPVAIRASADFDAAGRNTGFGLALAAEEGGDLQLTPGSRLPFQRLTARMAGTDTRMALEEARLELPGGRGATLEADGDLRRTEGGWVGELRASLDRLDIAELPALWPAELAPEAREALSVAIPRGLLRETSLRIGLAAGTELSGWRATEGRIAGGASDLRLVLPAGGTVAIESASFHAMASAEAMAIETLTLRLPAPGGTSTVEASGQARLEAGRWRGGLDLALDRISLADLPQLWPQGVAEGARDWITSNITAGEASGGRWRIEAESAPGFVDAALTGLSGTAELRQTTVYWLRPMPPVRGLQGRAQFGLTEITVQAAGGRLDNAAGQPGGIELKASTLRFLLPRGGTASTEMAIQLAGPVTETVAVLRHPRLRLFERRPFPVQAAGGSLEGRLNIAFPMVAHLTMDMVRLGAEAKVTNARFTRLLLERDLEEGSFDLAVDMEQLRLNGSATLNTVPLRINVEMDFRSGPANQVVLREAITGRPDARRIAELGFDMGALVTGPIALEVRTERRRNGQYTVNLRGDLRDSVLAFPPLGWTKPAGSPGRADASLRLQGDQLTSIEGIRIEALELALRARAVARGGRIERVELQETGFGASRLVGDARAPTAPGGPWAISLRGPVLDLRSVFGPSGHVAGGARDAQVVEGPQPPLALDLRFDQVMLAPGRDVFAAQARGRLDAAGVLREANLRARTSRTAGNFELVMTPRGEARQLRGSAEDGGALLRAFGLIGTIEGGRMQLNAEYAESRPGTPLTGTAELESFTVRNAPALGKLLQAMTLFGLVEAVQGGSGLVFNRAVVPFSLSPSELRLNDARAFSASLGLTARGRVLRERVILDLDGTIVPAYFFNTLLGNLPLVGRLFSPEAGGGVFAATFRAQGPPEDAEITVNPLAIVTPGFLRGMFGLAETGRPGR
ncbi:AsmA-like C-terminal region-containing protein [Sediminicoccus rosea]|uniref:AsmA-like C-terminal region-containing protein n=1 Tax=Sediminicoccus rosea TaxID=1225128 RepID=A0ABZ0PCG4_9PROT|nr:AsmA-like C-terminal region-containing protein [Sediminicoccus rosea]WPB83251.1 AsmA-like C-terminal region-containing protein [Sediminicoccus rosea]